MSKVIFDIIHGFIEVDELALSIIDKPEFLDRTLVAAAF